MVASYTETRAAPPAALSEPVTGVSNVLAYARGVPIGDGASHPLSGLFATLGAAQTAFPQATALTNELARMAIQAACDAGHNIFVPDGEYVIDAESANDGSWGGIAPRSNSRLTLGPNAVLRARASSSPDYSILRVHHVSNVRIAGGTLRGERDDHIGSGGEYGYGLSIWGSTDIWVADQIAENCWGDGYIIVHATGGGGVTPSRDVKFTNVTSRNNRRQGLSIIALVGGRFTACTFAETNGTSPQSGVDIESGGFGPVDDVEFIGCAFLDNAGAGIEVYNLGYANDTGRVRVRGGSALRNGLGVAFIGDLRSCEVEGIEASDNETQGVYVSDAPAGAVTVRGVTAVGNSQATHNATGNIVVQNSTGVRLIDNLTRKGSGAKQPSYGISLLASADTLLVTNDLAGGGATGDLGEYLSTGTVRVLNVLAGGSPASGFLGAPSTVATAPSTGVAATAHPSARTYALGLWATPSAVDGAHTLGAGNPAAEAMTEVRGGPYKSGDAGSSVSGVRLQRGTATAGFETVAEFDDTAKLPLGIQVGGGTPLKKIAMGTAAVDPPSIAAGAKGTATLTITGAAAGDVVILNAPSALEAGLLVMGWYISGADTMTIMLYNATGSPIDGASLTWRYEWHDLT